MSSDQPKVSIVILNWNSYEVTRDCFLSLRKLAYPNFEVVLVDNGSIDSSAEKLAQEFPETRVIKNDQNLGFTGGSNNVLRGGVPRRTEHFVLLNYITNIAPNFLAHAWR